MPFETNGRFPTNRANPKKCWAFGETRESFLCNLFGWNFLENSWRDFVSRNFLCFDFFELNRFLFFARFSQFVLCISLCFFDLISSSFFWLHTGFGFGLVWFGLVDGVVFQMLDLPRTNTLHHGDSRQNSACGTERNPMRTKKKRRTANPIKSVAGLASKTTAQTMKI